MIPTHATGAKENQMFLAIVPQCSPTPIPLHSYGFELQMSKFHATPYRACIAREYFEDFSDHNTTRGFVKQTRYFHVLKAWPVCNTWYQAHANEYAYR